MARKSTLGMLTILKSVKDLRTIANNNKDDREYKEGEEGAFVPVSELRKTNAEEEPVILYWIGRDS